MSAPFRLASRPLTLITYAAWLVCVALPLSAQARPVDVYEVDVAGHSPGALQDAMREALVRATGHREAAGDPVLASIVQNAEHYVKNYTKGPEDEDQVVFDGDAVQRAIAAVGRAVWRTDRPFTLVVLYPPLPRQADDSARAELEREAEHRGLPISLLPISVVDATGAPLPREAIMQTAQRYGADEVLVGRSDSAASAPATAPAPTPAPAPAPGTASTAVPVQWRWTLYTSFNSPTWTGPLDAGIDGTVDTLAPPVDATVADVDAVTRVEVEGVTGLNDYASIEQLLLSVPGVRRAQVAEVDPNQVTYELNVRGGADALDRELASTGRLARTASTNGTLVYQYHP